MKKILLTLALVFSVGSVRAGDWKDWYATTLKGLKAKVEKKLESKNKVSAVAAVRGARQGGDPRALYWKGGVSDAASKQLAAERKQLTDAVQLVVDENLPLGKAAIEKFIKDNPDSVYLSEAKEALEKLPSEDAKPAPAQAEPSNEDSAQPKEAKPAEVKEEKPAAAKTPAGSGN